MKVLFSQLPQSPWWGKGYVEAYENNWAMHTGPTPSHHHVKKEHAMSLDALKKHCDIHIIDFPEELDTHKLYKHDGIFVRDSFISNHKGEFVIANFREKLRQPETKHIEHFLKEEGHKLHYLPVDALAEGGEFFYIPKQHMLFAGVSRNNEFGVRQTAKILGIKNIFIVRSKSFHLDTVFCTVLDPKGNLAALIACLPLIDNAKELVAFAKKKKIPLFNIDEIDSIGRDGKGKISVNCLALHGVLVGGSIFQTKGVEQALKKLDIHHEVAPITQFLLSGGGIHCLTNELIS